MKTVSYVAYSLMVQDTEQSRVWCPLETQNIRKETRTVCSITRNSITSSFTKRKNMKYKFVRDFLQYYNGYFFYFELQCTLYMSNVAEG